MFCCGETWVIDFQEGGHIGEVPLSFNNIGST